MVDMYHRSGSVWTEYTCLPLTIAGGMRNTVVMATPTKTTPISFTAPTITPTITAATKVVIPSSPIKPKELSAEHVSSIMGVPESVDDHFAKALGEEWARVKSLQQHSITAQSL